MVDLTDRQLHILKVIIEEYIDTAMPVASETLDKKYNLGVSPATIRNEMVRLTTSGYLKQPHTSAGRTPTPLALKFYVDRLMKPKELSVSDEVSVKQNIWDHRKEMDELLREATRTLAKQSKTLSLAATDEGDFFTSGIGNILEMPEFYDIDITKHLLDTLDEAEYWWKILSGYSDQDESLYILVGEEFGGNLLNNCGGIFVSFRSAEHKGAIGVVGPTRLNYSRLVPVVRYMGSLINDLAKNL
ncbi:MAG: heat-inducible transcription repressor HrcA, heat-inducible transcriptional repressor [Candidatus Gottesmanbacteria bacterium GW2011_GWA2_43_14]|uniref:Heat-inducible transcription repressor HrcA n=1 Tax=Candidatus Gottesmanbacteria bacterium GW2011_GWA2_43_14 TaxID=1618443 RepID=A0A0G1FT88_9BACT|nr:MAG: heat-inducible transcription repressor HrcA, heat-inducible transcriptional repressor [Candidatus Gottesmanbacteria bacterium GW2011_GWA2_43_14]